MATKLETTIERLSKQLKQARSKQSLKLAKERNETMKKQRALDTRRKILIGSLAEKLLPESENFRLFFRSQANVFFTRAADRELLGLPPLPAKKPPSQPQ